MHGLAQFRAIEQHQLQRPAYAGLLTALLLYHGAMVELAERAGVAALTSSADRRERLLRDLDALGSVEPDLHLPLAIAGRPETLGALYVAEGSALGGRVIARQLDYLLAGQDGRRFFSGSREDEPAWHRLLATIETAGGDQDALKSMVAGAEASFAHFERCIGVFG